MDHRTKLLRAIRERLSSPHRWTKGALARTSSGKATGVETAEASCWCLQGALFAECSSSELDSAEDSVRRALHNTITAYTAFTNLAFFNDALDTTHKDVLAVIDLTLCKLSKGKGNS